MDKKSFIIYQNWAEIIKRLPNEDAGELIKAICNYTTDSDYEISNPYIDALFEGQIKPQLNADDEKYQKKRERMAELNRNRHDNVTRSLRNRHDNVGDTDTVTDTVTVTDTDNVSPTEIKKEKVSPNGDTKKKNPNPPSLEEVREYCQQRNSSVDPEQFYEYFNTGGWVDSKGNKVKNWKQKVITWEKFNQGHGDNRASKITPFDANSYILSKIKGGGQ